MSDNNQLTPNQELPENNTNEQPVQQNTQGYSQPSQYGQSYQQPNQYGQGYQQPNQYGQGYQQPNQYGQSYQQPNQYGQGYQQPNQYGQGYQQPNQYGQGYQQPNQYQQGYPQPVPYQQNYQQPYFKPFFDHTAEKSQFKKCMIKLAIFCGIMLLNSFVISIGLIMLIRPLLLTAYMTNYDLYYLTVWLTNDVAAYIVPALSAYFLFRSDFKNKKLYQRDPRYKPVLSDIIVFAVCCFLGSLASIITNWIASIFDTLFGTGEIVDNMEGMLPTADQPLSIIILFFFVAVAAPIVEELIYRKLLLYPLRKYSDGFAVVVTALLFGFMHGNLNQAPYAIVVGLLFGTLAVRSNSVIPTMILHVVNNLTVTFGNYYPIIMGEENASAVADFCAGFLNVFFFLGIPATVVFFATGFHQSRRTDALLSKEEKAQVLVRTPAAYIFALGCLAMLIPLS